MSNSKFFEDSKFTSDEIEEYRDAFGVFDTDNDGVITTKELGTLLRYEPICDKLARLGNFNFLINASQK